VKFLIPRPQNGRGEQDIMQARTACDEGRADDAVALYDRLIAQIDLVVMGSQDRYR
jgi:hypothetical protein